MRKNITKIFKDTSFAIDVETNLKTVDILDVTFNLNNGTYRPYKKPNDLLSCINKSSNHPPQIINQPKTINENFSRNSSIEEIFNSSTHQQLNSIKVQVFFEKNIDKKHLCHHDKNYCYFCKSNIPVINLIAGSRNIIKLSKIIKFVKD